MNDRGDTASEIESRELEFSTVSQHRGWYFVEYSPCVDGWLSILQVVVLESAESGRVAATMEAEARRWFARYPSPVMVSAFDVVGDLMCLEDVRTSDCLVAYAGLAPGDVRLEWRLVPEEEVSGKLMTNDDRLRVFADVPHDWLSFAQRRTDFEAFAKKVRVGRQLTTAWLFMWLAVIPASWAIVQWAGPRWLGVIVLLYSLFKATQQALKLAGVRKPSHRERDSDAKLARMEEYFEECERNPEGFQRLKLENFEREAREKTLMEARELGSNDTRA